MDVNELNEIKKRFNYNSFTGVFTYKICIKKSHPIDSVAGTRTKKGYIVFSVNKKSYQAHRIAWLLFYKELPNLIIDHIDGNKTNNAISNLRLATRSENAQNQKKAQKNNKESYLGVNQNKRSKNKSYETRIQINGKRIQIGTFKTSEEASEAYINKKRELHPFNTL
jgi:hypothetical protein